MGVTLEPQTWKFFKVTGKFFQGDRQIFPRWQANFSQVTGNFFQGDRPLFSRWQANFFKVTGNFFQGDTLWVSLSNLKPEIISRWHPMGVTLEPQTWNYFKVTPYENKWQANSKIPPKFKREVTAYENKWQANSKIPPKFKRKVTPYENKWQANSKIPPKIQWKVTPSTRWQANFPELETWNLKKKKTIGLHLSKMLDFG